MQFQEYFVSSEYQPKNDHEPGFIYLMSAEGYHGLIPGFYLSRCQIGLSRNPEARLNNFHANQPIRNSQFAIRNSQLSVVTGI